MERRFIRSYGGAGLVFFDPDNGISEDTCASAKKSPKHIYLNELKRYWERKQSLLIYHHLNRARKHTEQIEKLQNLLLNALLPSGKVIPYWMRRGTSRVFFLAIHTEHANILRPIAKCASFDPLAVPKWKIKEKK